MKTKIFSLMVVLSILVSLVAMAAPVSAATNAGTKVPTVSAANDVETEVVYDEGYVSLLGSDLSGNGTIGNPYQTITGAVNHLPFKGDTGPGQWDPTGSTLAKPDRINVMPSAPGWYGGTSAPEHIVVNKPVIIRAYPGATIPTDYIVNVAGQGPPVMQVIEIINSNVTIDGLSLMGAKTGVWAHGTQGNLIENVQILNCLIKVDETDPNNGTGIEMEFVKYPIIDHNDIRVGMMGGQMVLSVPNAWGILLFSCFQSTITHNTLNIKGYAINANAMAFGIITDNCPKSVIADNPAINVMADGDSLAVGIRVENSPLIDVLRNIIHVETNGTTFAMAFGIKVFQSDRSDVCDNGVTVNDTGMSGHLGFMLGMGIWLWSSNESNVNNNTVAVTGMGKFNPSMLAELPVSLTAEDLADLADVDSIINATIGQTLNFTVGAGVVIGIKVSNADMVKVLDNTVTVKLATDFVSQDLPIEFAQGAAVAMGIIGCHADKIMVNGNTVNVDKAHPLWPRPDVMTYIKVWAVGLQPVAFGGGLAFVLGIGLLDCDLGMVCDNNVTGHSTLNVDIKSVPTPSYLETGSVLARVNSEIMSAIYQSFSDTIKSEEIGAKISGDLPSIESFGMGGGTAAGIGILVVGSYGAVVDGNDPVIGTGDLTGSTWSKESNDQLEAVAFGAGLGLGLGIAVVDSMSAKVNNNSGVDGTGMAALDIGALHDPPVLIQDAEAFGGGAGVGIGILVCGMAQWRVDAGEVTGATLDALEAAPQGAFWAGRTEVINNQEVTATGAADKVCVCAEDQIPDHPAIAIGKGLGVALGIAAICEPCILIKDNTVSANGNAEVCVGAKAVDTFDPLSMGGAAGIGMGITSVGSWRSQIIGNQSTGQGTAKGFVLAIETPVSQSPALGFGGSLGLGKGILVFGSGGSLVHGNSVATGLGDAKTMVLAINDVPLDSAVALSLASGIGNGIAVVFSPCTDVVECNTAAGEGTARVFSWSDADFDYRFKLGVAVSIDIYMEMWPNTLDVSEASFDGQGGGPHFGKVNYNSMVDATPLGWDSCKVIVIDAGLLKIGWPRLDAQFNWWNDPTGPTGFGPGTGEGEAVYWVGKPVDFTPWLYVVHTEVLDSQIGKFGFYIPLSKGVNTISTPIALDQEVVPSRTWGDIVANSGLLGKIKYQLRWDDATQAWVNLLGTDNIDPLNAYYVYLFDGCMNLILMVNSDDGHPYAMPSRILHAPGTTDPTHYHSNWVLIGPNPIFPEDDIRTDDALASIEKTPAGLPGYTQAISPVVRSQPAWYYVPGSKFAPDMLIGRGYWVWVQNPVTLVGFGFSPLPDQLGGIH